MNIAKVFLSLHELLLFLLFLLFQLTCILLILIFHMFYIILGCLVTFCKSGKDRTGMVVTYRQARKVDDSLLMLSGSAANTLSSSDAASNNSTRVLRVADIFRLHGCRLSICEKNIGTFVFRVCVYLFPCQPFSIWFSYPFTFFLYLL